MPGAFTPTCSSQAPGYIEKYDEFKAKGINEIYIITVNDTFVTKCDLCSCFCACAWFLSRISLLFSLSLSICLGLIIDFSTTQGMEGETRSRWNA